MTDAGQPVAAPADDELHAFDPAEWWTVETVWFAFTVPERKLNTVVYLVNRPAMGVCALHIDLFDDTGSSNWDRVYARSLWQLPLPNSLLKIDMDDVGFHFEVLEPLTRYRIRYQAHEVSFDVTWDALAPPRMAGGTHIDQFGRVTGTLVLHGEAIPVDCLQMRDRSWTRRSDLEGVHGGYTYALASERSAFLMSSVATGEDRFAARGGWLLRDGVMCDLVSGERRVARRSADGDPLEVVVSGVDSAGRSFEAQGACVSRAQTHVSGNIYGIDSLTRWSLDGASCWGEDQDVWTPEAWRARRRTRA